MHVSPVWSGNASSRSRACMGVPLPLRGKLQVWSSLGFLAVLTLLSWFGSRGRQVPFPHPLSEQARVHMLRRLRLRDEQTPPPSAHGAAQLELGPASGPAAVP